MSNTLPPITIFWFRRDLRLDDNVGLCQALTSGFPVLPIFIFDKNILDELDKDDARVSFIHASLENINQQLTQKDSGLNLFHGKPLDVFKELASKYTIKHVYTNHDYEPYALERDEEIRVYLTSNDIPFSTYKDQVIIEKSEVVKADGNPYTVYTPFKNKWLQTVDLEGIKPIQMPNDQQWAPVQNQFYPLERIGFAKSNISVRPFSLQDLSTYGEHRDIPGADKTSYVSPHLRFGTFGIRSLFQQVKQHSVYVSELIWREFFMQILYHFPSVVEHNFKRKYDGIDWENNESNFKKWCDGETGYPMVDAGMRQLNETGYMHNRVRMVTASFLCKHLLIDWRWGEAYFAKKLLDFELASNNGNWQWAAGTGCDAAPYFRVFNPSEQLKKFDPNMRYVKKWVPEVMSGKYPKPIVEHKFARNRALERYKAGIQ